MSQPLATTVPLTPDVAPRPNPVRAEPVRRDPDRTRDSILQAAVVEFSEKGLGGARIDEIALRAGANKRMLYHYFGNKDDLYLAALESVYADIRAHERTLDLEHRPPLDAMRELAVFTWSYFLENPHFLSMLNTENMHRAKFLGQSAQIKAMHSPLIELLAGILARGQAAGVMRTSVDPMQLYISIASLGYFYLSNVHTLSVIFGRDFASAEEKAARERHICEVVLSYLRP
jgi:AcrR family transcriptional regulator